MEAKNNNGLICTIVILVIVVLGLEGYIIYDKVLKDTPEAEKDINKDNDKNQTNEKNLENNLMSDENAIQKGEKLFKEAIDIFYLSSWFHPDYTTYINDERCGLGIGCIKIANWSDMKTKFTSKFISSLNNKDKAVNYGIHIIDNEGYLIDGFADYQLPEFVNLNVIEKSENEIVFNAMLTNQGIEYNTKFIIKIEDTIWKIDEFSLEK